MEGLTLVLIVSVIVGSSSEYQIRNFPVAGEGCKTVIKAVYDYTNKTTYENVYVYCPAKIRVKM